MATEDEIEAILKPFKLIRDDCIYEAGNRELRGWQQTNSTIVLFVGKKGKYIEEMEDISFPLEAIEPLMKWLSEVKR